MLESYTEPELQRWLNLRAIEWASWPSFIAQPIVPMLFIFVSWYWVLLGLFIVDLLWCAVRYSFVSPRLSQLAVFFVLLKWPISLGAAIYLFIDGHYILGVLAL